jgi:Tat protein translocase TatB subunit
MFGIGWAELLLILAVALIVVKPEQLPQTAKSLGRAYRQFREVISESGRVLDREAAELRKLNPMNELRPDSSKSERSDQS